MKDLLEEVCYIAKPGLPTVDGKIYTEEELKRMVARDPRLEWDDKYKAVIYRNEPQT
jgi:hypothetical protein